jgi:glucose-1-phosphate cytidylyltransferase
LTRNENFDVPVVILCGGKGLRIREVSELLPKPMLEIGGRPILWHIMRIYAHHGFRRFVLCLGHQGNVVRDYFFNFHARNQDVTLDFNGHETPPEARYHGSDADGLDWSVTLAETGINTMTGGRIARIARYLDAPCFMLTYGDGVGDIDVGATLEWHHRHRRLVTVTGVRPQSRFGQLDIAEDQVREFTEKPQVDNGYVSGGYMVVQRSFIERYLSTDEACVLERHGLARAARDGAMTVYRHDGFWMPMDNSLEYNALNALWSSGKAPWKVWRGT